MNRLGGTGSRVGRGAAALVTTAVVLIVTTGRAAAASEAHDLDGAAMSAAFGIPFAGLLLSIAILPLAAPTFWHHHFGKVAAFWSLAFVLPFAVLHGTDALVPAVLHTALADFVPFVILLGALFTIAGGIHVSGNLHGSPALNTALLAIGTVLASFVGTTGASMVMIRPLIRANDGRRHRVHTIVFFIFLVSNIGGSLTPLGDPPLFLGYLRGVDFFWTTTHLFPETAFAVGLLLALFYAVDRWLYAGDADFQGRRDPTPDTARIGIEGGINILFLLIVVAAVLMSGSWSPGVSVSLLGIEIGLEALLRDLVLVGAAAASIVVTPKIVHEKNRFGWDPILEVAKLFAGIFATIIPVIAMLRAGRDGAFAPLVDLVSAPDGSPRDDMYFWTSGLLSSFLDNAPTYLVFFNLAGGDATHLMTALPNTLAAISCGAVFMGANSYIGNAPNFMVKSIAEGAGIRMPSFFGYMLWSGGILLPLFALMTLVFFRG